MCELLERAKEKQGNISYYEIAQRLGVADQLVRKWKKNESQPNGVNTLKLAIMAEATPIEALKLMQQEKGFSTLSFSIMTFLASGLAMTGVKLHILCILCKIQNIKANCWRPATQA